MTQPYNFAMSSHTISEAKDNLADLIDRAIAGEGVVITRNGKPVAELHPVPEQRESRPVTKEGIEWLARNRVGKIMPKEDAATLLSRMRDEDWER